MSEARGVRPVVLTGAVSGWLAVAGNAALWRELQALGLWRAQGGWLLALTLAGMVGAVLFTVLSLFAWPRLLKAFALLLLVAAAAGGYSMWTFHIVIDGNMATSAMQTDWREARDLLSWQFAAALLAGAVLPGAWVLRTRLAYRPWRGQALRNLSAAGAGLLLVVALLLASFQPLAAAMRNHKHLRYLLNPLNTLYAAGQLAVPRARATGVLQPLGRDARLAPSTRPPLLVLVVGETGRSGNFGINGYPRATTPELEAAGAASFRDAWSCGTHTAASVPCMFSHAGREAFLARAVETENLLDVLQHAGLAVLWIDNQAGGCKGVCDRVPHINLATGGAADCPAGGCPDGILVAGLDARLAALPAARRDRGVVLVLHPMGSHGPAYAERSPAAAKRFLPECTSSHLPDCSGEQLRNAYDNSIAYQDHVLGEAIRWLRTRTDYDGALLYVADHGESLGENNVYLHGLPYAIAPDVQKHVPWVTWLSPEFEARTGVTLACLRAASGQRVTHDHLFHSVLGLLQVSTSAYRRSLDAYAGCSAH